MINKNRILVLGATGFLGQHVCMNLDNRGIKYEKTSQSLGINLQDKKQTFRLFETVKPDYVLNCAAYVGGIQFGYKHFAEIFRNNLEITINLLEAIMTFKTKRMVNPISNCAYPAKARLFKEEEFWNGQLHESVMVYGFVRKASWIGSWAYNYQYKTDTINIILSNMYGPNDHFDEERSHALGALIMKFVTAKRNDFSEVIVWGTGNPVREWLYVEDGAEAMVRSLFIEPYVNPINIGIGSGLSIRDLAYKIKKYVGYNGKIIFDTTKEDGAAYKTVDGSLAEKIFKWKPQIDIDTGIKKTIEWYLQNN